ncbi:VanZ family protein [Halorhabdus amylolytica]|uniref:VanZ family protein n=1 Tax=Halorhabdus amylolytica TaxID=2559573 RepID=UPI0010AB3A29|nr:VanZ family protein [Halorhabdus amylolytica]
MRRPPVPLVPRTLRWGFVLVTLAVVVYFSLVTVPPRPPATRTPFWDKYLHFLAYFGVGLALAYATATYRDRPSVRAGLVLGGAIAFGAAIELFQGALPHRYFGWGDLLANCLGAGLVALWFPIERRIRYVRARRLAESIAPR